MVTHFTITTRSSPLALWQAQYFQNQLKKANLDAQIKPVSHAPVVANEQPFHKEEFVKEVQKVLKNQQADFAVHSLKDVPFSPDIQTLILSLSPRGTTQDALVFSQSPPSFSKWSSWFLEENLFVGTSSPRRQAYLKHFLGIKEVMPLRGNVETRLKKLEENPLLGAICLAKVGLERLQINPTHLVTLPLSFAPHAIGQGIMALEGRKNLSLSTKRSCLSFKSPLSDWMSGVERSCLIQLNGSCSTALGFHWLSPLEVILTYTPHLSQPFRQTKCTFPLSWFEKVFQLAQNHPTYQVWCFLDDSQKWQKLIQHHLTPFFSHEMEVSPS